MNNTKNSFASRTRRSFLAQGSILLAGHNALMGAQSAAESEAPRFVEVRTAYGQLRGMAK